MPESYYVITWSILYDIEISFAHSVILRRPVFLPDDVRISSFKVLQFIFIWEPQKENLQSKWRHSK